MAAVPQSEIISEAKWSRVLAAVLASAAMLAPCWWHAHVEAGDVASHTYNAWLANNIDKLHGVSLVWQWTNVVYDVVLAHLCRWFGYSAGEKVAVSAVVLALFWGMWALVAACRDTGQRPGPHNPGPHNLRGWSVVPVVAMLTYSWTFHMGLMNFCLSAGLSCLALALWIRRKVRATAGALPLLLLAWLAHALPVLVALACGAYAIVSTRLRAKQQFLLLLGAIGGILLASEIVLRWFSAGRAPLSLSTALGVNQFLVYTVSPYRWIGYATVVLLWAAVMVWHRNQWRELLLSPPLQLAILFAVAVAALPTALGGLGSGVSFVTERLSLAVPLCACILLARARPPRWIGITLAVPALAYFAVLWAQSGVMNHIEEGITSAARQAPAGSRVVLLMPYGDNTTTIMHMIDRACVEHCFSYANYEPSTRQFRVRGAAGNGIAAPDPATSFALQVGQYVVQPRDAPLYEVYVCDRAADRFCVRELRAGDQLAP